MEYHFNSMIILRNDTIGLKIQWYDKKFKDTLNTVILQIR